MWASCNGLAPAKSSYRSLRGLFAGFVSGMQSYDAAGQVAPPHPDHPAREIWCASTAWSGQALIDSARYS